MQESYLNSPVMYTLALTLIHFLWQGGLVALALKIVLSFTSHQKTQLRYAFSAIAMVINLILPAITFFILYKPTYLQLTNSLPQLPVSGAELSRLTIQNNEWYSNTIEYLPYLSFIWLSVISVLSLKLLIELYTVNQLSHKQTILPDNDLLQRFNLLVEQLGLKKTPKLLLSFNTHVPMAIGWLKPMVLIPVSMLSGLTPSQLDMLILHELAHIKRHDYIVNFIQTIVEIILFFHPAVLWVSNQMRNEREYCSDDIAVHHCGNPIAYARTLTETASICNKHQKRSIPEMAMAASGGDLTQRVLRLVNEHHCSSQSNSGKWFASLTVLSIVFFICFHQLVQLSNMDINANQYTLSHNQETLNTVKFTQVDTDIDIIKDTTKSQQVIASYEAVQVPVPATVKNNSTTEQHFTEAKSTVSSNLLTPETDNAQIISVTSNNVTLFTEVVNQPLLHNTTVADGARPTDEIKDKESTSSLLKNSESKSISDIAFEQTDSSLKTSVMSNKYSKEIALLSDRPEKSNVVENTLSYNTPTNYEETINLVPEATKALSIKSYPPQKTAAKLIFSTDPKYPSTAKRKGIELEVKVDFIIDKQGNVRDITFHPKNNANYFRAAVRAAVKQWKFEPAKYDGKIIDSKMSKIFSFSLLR